MEEQNQPLPCPIADESAPAQAAKPKLLEAVEIIDDLIAFHEDDDLCRVHTDTLQEVKQMVKEGIMGLRATLTLALNQADHSPTGYTLDESDALDTMTATVEQALIQVDTVLGLEEPTEDASEGLTHEDFQHDPYAGDAEGEMRAEAEAERMADAAHEIACEGWTLDPYDGF